MLEADGGGFWERALGVEPQQGAYTVWGSDGMIGAKAAEAGGEGGFVFPSIDEMNAVLGMWKDRQASITKKKNLIELARGQLSQLADDPESQGYLRRARESLDLLYNQHQSMLDYVGNYIQKLTDATNAKQAGEDANKAAFKGTTEN
ncbi:hypothetical protein [Amycolatopsis sacchari]|uniref:hypothetical protein n=1 Tax=Amycolatopsis sacchari TaxID=115433 RepID=UPI003EB9BA8B